MMGYTETMQYSGWLDIIMSKKEPIVGTLGEKKGSLWCLVSVITIELRI